MIEAFSNSPNKIKTLTLLVISVLLAFASIIIGIDDNPPGILLALLAAIAFVLAFVHPWRAARKFMFLLLASFLGFVLFIALNIVLDSIGQNPATSDAFRDLIQGPASDALNLIFAMICSAAFIVGVAGSVVMFFWGRRKAM